MRFPSSNPLVFTATLGLALTFPLILPTAANAAPAAREGLQGASIPSPASSFIAVRQVAGRTLFDFAPSLLGKDLLWYVERGSVSASVPEGAGQATASLMFRLERIGDAIVIRNLSPGANRRAATPSPQPAEGPTSDQKVPPINRSVAESTVAPPVATLAMAPSSPVGRITVDVTDLFRRDLPEVKLREVFGAATVDPSRSFIESVKVFPRNVVVGALVTAQPLSGTDSVAAVLKHSWTLLPDVPMRSRNFDNRVGIFAVDFEEYSENSNAGVVSKSIIRRYRLEKKDPNAKVSEPVKPIVYYIGRTVPIKWRKYMKQAVEDWQVAFEAAGFKNAIIAKDAPTEAEDPNWDPSDTRHSVIRWVANPVVNAVGPNIADPRSGEILSAHILIWEDVLKIANSWYYAMCSAVDPRAQALPLNDELTGRMIRYIVAHEVGHTLGLRHNHRASTAYTVAQLRDPAFCAKHGSTASIMAYGRMNYVAQPGDGVAPESLMPRVGPYDLHAIRWSYAQLPPEQEAKTLAEWAEEALKNPWLAFGGEDLSADVDPQVQTQNIGKERVEATRLGMKNLDIAMANLLPAFRKGNATYDSLYDRWIEVLGTRHDYLKSVVKEIGGREETRTGADREPQFRAVPANRQREALDYILKDGLNWNPVYYSNGVLANGIPFNFSHDLRRYQGALMGTLFAPVRLAMISDTALDQGDEPQLGLLEYFDRITEGVFAEAITNGSPSLLRRALHRDFFFLVNAQRQTNPTDESRMFAQGGAPSFIVEALSSSLGTDTLSALRAALTKLEPKLAAAATQAKDPLIRAHWQDCLAHARKFLGS